MFPQAGTMVAELEGYEQRLGAVESRIQKIGARDPRWKVGGKCEEDAGFCIDSGGTGWSRQPLLGSPLRRRKLRTSRPSVPPWICRAQQAHATGRLSDADYGAVAERDCYGRPAGMASVTCRIDHNDPLYFSTADREYRVQSSLGILV